MFRTAIKITLTILAAAAVAVPVAAAGSPKTSTQGPAYSLGPALLQYRQHTGFFAKPKTSIQGPSEGLKADGLRLQGMAQVYKDLADARNFPTAQGIKADGLRLQGIAQVYKEIGFGSTPDAFERPAAAHPAYSLGPALLQYRQHTGFFARPSATAGSGFDWGDAAIGGGAIAGLILLLLGVIAAVTGWPKQANRRLSHT